VLSDFGGLFLLVTFRTCASPPVILDTGDDDRDGSA
jgi:hypothetical protein